MLQNQASSGFIPETVTIKTYVEPVIWPLLLCWINGAVLFVGFGSFAFVQTALGHYPDGDLWAYAGGIVLGLGMVWLAWRDIARLRGQDRPVFVFDEKTSQISFKDHSFNFGMLDFILWERDFRAETRGSRKLRTRMLVGYRTGIRVDEGEQVGFAVDAVTSAAQMARLQQIYLRLMVIVKSRRKLQRESRARVEAAQADQDLRVLAEAVQELSAPDLLERADIQNSADPQDRIAMIFDEGDTVRVVAGVGRALDSKPVNLLFNFVFGVLALMLTLMNAAFLWAILT